MKVLIQFKNGEQVVGDKAALILPQPFDEIEDTSTLDGSEYLVLTGNYKDTNMKIMKEVD